MALISFMLDYFIEKCQMGWFSIFPNFCKARINIHDIFFILIIVVPCYTEGPFCQPFLKKHLDAQLLFS